VEKKNTCVKNNTCVAPVEKWNVMVNELLRSPLCAFFLRQRGRVDRKKLKGQQKRKKDVNSEIFLKKM
jgi:hypothetical protein